MVHNIPVVIVAGLGKATRAIGQNNALLWHVPDDLKRFKELSLGKPTIMGRKTFESIVAIIGKPLPGRTNIIVTRDPNYSYPGTFTAHSLEAAFAKALEENPSEIHIGGGAQLYEQAWPVVDRLYLTLFDDDTVGDAFFPEFTDDFMIEKTHQPKSHNGLTYQWVDYIRK